MAVHAFAQQGAWPNRRITIVVPSQPGGGVDGTARLLAKRMSEEWGQAVVVENQGGADGLLGTQRVATAAPDGYTMLMQIPSLLLLRHNARDIGFDPATAFTPVSEVGRTPSAISVSAKLPVRNLQELVAYCKAQATPCSWGSGQQLSYLYGRRLFSVLGLNDLTHAPYKGTAPVITDVLGGHLTIGVTSIAAPLIYHQSGQARILAVNLDRRSTQAPDVPTFREAGLQFPVRGAWYGLFVPRRTPPEVVAKIEKLVTGMQSDPAAAAAIRVMGAEPVFGTAQDFAAAMQDDEQFLESLVKQYPLR